MINNIIKTLAVPYGYTKELPNMENNEVDWHEAIVCNNNYRNSTSVRNGPMLPDLILDTPPPSPLRRAHSHHFTFPEKSTDKSSPDASLPTTPTSSLPSSPYSLPPTPTSSLPPTPNDELTVPTMCVERIQAVRRQILSDPEARIPPTQLPQLTWNVPLPSRIRRHQPEPQICHQETEEQKTWRNVGGDLKRIADKFHLDYVMVRDKSNHSNTGRKLDDIAIPIVFTHCLQVSLVAIICWRLLNKFG